MIIDKHVHTYLDVYRNWISLVDASTPQSWAVITQWVYQWFTKYQLKAQGSAGAIIWGSGIHSPSNHGCCSLFVSSALFSLAKIHLASTHLFQFAIDTSTLLFSSLIYLWKLVIFHDIVYYPHLLHSWFTSIGNSYWWYMIIVTYSWL